MNIDDIFNAVDKLGYKTKLYMSPAGALARCFIIEPVGTGTAAYGQGTTRYDAMENAYRQLMDRMRE